MAIEFYWHKDTGERWWHERFQVSMHKQGGFLSPPLPKKKKKKKVVHIGSSWAAVLEERDGLNCPVDLYLEGTDQHRGWFRSSLLTSIGTRGDQCLNVLIIMAQHRFLSILRGLWSATFFLPWYNSTRLVVSNLLPPLVQLKNKVGYGDFFFLFSCSSNPLLSNYFYMIFCHYSTNCLSYGRLQYKIELSYKKIQLRRPLDQNRTKFLLIQVCSLEVVSQLIYL
ncbi:hypothetical protein NE237_032401 [Protea cynaroides]|uniref:Aminoacyl-tRNA synthetase class Ia domain-containing protein n=1 Tax=Protea cynaroides TaxID=273540 RepID=A0A9Q0L473_9MAGN|nr:hypothetical protein NE237_032401 [Protea cynaroides]